MHIDQSAQQRQAPDKSAIPTEATLALILSALLCTACGGGAEEQTTCSVEGQPKPAEVCK